MGCKTPQFALLGTASTEPPTVEHRFVGQAHMRAARFVASTREE
jgi:hypothetical protein